MKDWRWLLLLIIPVVFGIVGIFVYWLKRHRGHGYMLSKFSAFTRIRFQRLERRRQTYCPASDKCDCHPHTSAAHIEPNLSCPHRSPTLYMSFAGAAMIVGGVRTTEWRGSMSLLHQDSNDKFDALFFTDPAQCFYLQDPEYQWDGIEYYRRLIEIYSTLYSRVILIGASLGGSIVCMCADLATLSIAFNPILDPTLLGIAWRFMGAYCPSRQAHVVRDQVQMTMERIHQNQMARSCVLHVHWSQLSQSDRRQASRVVNGNKQLRIGQRKYLTSVLDYDVNHPYMCSTMGVHVWFHQCGRHVLAIHLKKTSQLIPLLKRHITAAFLSLPTISNEMEKKNKEYEPEAPADVRFDMV